MKRLRNFIKQEPLKSGVIAAAMLLTGFASYLLYQRPIVRAVSYDPCQITYAEALGGWDGVAEDEWNQSGFRYEVKLFRVEAKAPDSFWPNVVEAEPTYLASSGEGACNDFDGLVNTVSGELKWQGAQASAVRLGAPNLGEVNNNGQFAEPTTTKPAAAENQFLLDRSHTQAAVWVDDGAAAELENHDKSKRYVLWCQGYVKEGCDSVISAEGSLNQRGAGFLFTADNCPVSDCQDFGKWYTNNQGQGGVNYTAIIGLSEYGQLKPFYLHLRAVSTYAPRVGTWMTMTYKYPKESLLHIKSGLSNKNLEAGGDATINLELAKTGPDISELSAQIVSEGQPVEVVEELNIENTKELNEGRKISLHGKVRLTSSATDGKCYDLPIELTYRGGVNTEQKRQTLKLEYCVLAKPAPPATAVTYTYTTSRRGNFTSNFQEFINLSAQTLADARGWSKAGIAFRRVESGGDFELVLAEAEQVPTFSSGCDSTYSCRVGRYVIINESRWRTATPSWDGSLRDYRHMVINHEVGHFIGFGHYNCPSPGAPAPVMQQQSISLQGCKHNPWPTDSEIAAL